MALTFSFRNNRRGFPGPNFSGRHLRVPVFISFILISLILLLGAGLAGCGSTTSAGPPSGAGAVPTISSFTADPPSISSGTSSALNWTASGATSIAITPGTFTSQSASGSTNVSPSTTTTYTLTATNASGSVTSMAKVTVTSSGGSLAITTT